MNTSVNENSNFKVLKSVHKHVIIFMSFTNKIITLIMNSNSLLKLLRPIRINLQS